MAFIKASGITISFAEYSDVTSTDQRLFEANEGLTDLIVETALERATQRILTQIRASEWWRSYYLRQSGDSTSMQTSTLLLAPAVNPSRIVARQDDFTDLCVYLGLSQILLPKVADFGNADTAERQKISFYDEKYRKLLEELLEAGDWYDFNGDGTIASTEKAPSRQNLVRVR